MKIINRFRSAGVSLLSGFRRFPAASVLALAVTVLLVRLIHLDGRSGVSTDGLTRAAVGCVLAFPAALILHLLLERLQRPPAYKPLGILPSAGAFLPLAAGAFAYIWFLLPKIDDIPMIRTVFLTGALTVLFVVLPYWWRREGLALHATRLLMRLLVTVVFAGILMLALFAILFTLDRLLSANIRSEHYADAAVLVWALFAPLYMLAGIPGVREVPKPTDSPRLLRFLLHRILMPLHWVYTVILYVYSARILLEREWPHGIVSSLILAWLCIGLLVWFLSSPTRSDNRMAAFHHAAFPWAALPLFAILFSAIGMRVADYGITDERWFVIALAAWCCAASLFLAIRTLIRKREPETAGLRVIWLPVSLAAVMVATVAGPLSAFNVSIRSQNAQLEALLVRNDMLVSSRMRAPAGEIPAEDRQRISDILYWFEANHELTDVASLPDGMTLANAKDTLGFALDGAVPPGENHYARIHVAEANAFVFTEGFDRMIPLSYGIMQVEDSDAGITVRFDDDRILTLEHAGGTVYSQDFDTLFKTVVEKTDDAAADQSDRTVPQKELTFETQADGMRVKLVFLSLGGMTGTGNSDYQATEHEGWLLIDLP